MSKQASAPIHINLNGSYSIPLDGSKPVAGSVSGDLRLSVLDAFLQSLNTPLTEDSRAVVKLAEGFKYIADKCSDDLLAHSDVVLTVVTELDPQSNKMTHSFRLSLADKKTA